MFNFNDVTETMIARFWRKVDSSGGADACWPFMGGCKAAGYGNFFAKRETPGRYGKLLFVNAHKFAYVVTKGRLADELVVRHTCDNPRCCNPRHLLSGTLSDNQQDAVDRGRIDTAARSQQSSRIIKVVNETRRSFTESDIAEFIIGRSQGKSIKSLSKGIHYLVFGDCYLDNPLAQKLSALHARGIRFSSYPRNRPFGDLHPELQELTYEAIKVLELANRPTGMTLPPLQESLARADAALGLDTMPRLDRASKALELINELYA